MKKLLAIIFLYILASGCNLNEKTNRRLLRDALEDYKGSDFISAEKKMQHYTREYPGDYQGWSLLGTIEQLLNKDSLAGSHFNKALELNPKDYMSFTGLGVLQRRAGNYDKAAEYYNKAISIAPDYSRAYGSLLVIELKKGNFQRAIQLGEKATQLDPKDLGMLGNLAIAYHFGKQYEKRDEIIRLLEAGNYRYIENLQLIFKGEIGIEDI